MSYFHWRPPISLSAALLCGGLLLLLTGCGLFDGLDVDADNNDAPNTASNTEPNNQGSDACEECASDEICVDNQCIPDDEESCSEVLELCDAQCVDTDVHDMHCGDCGTPCVAGEYCRGGNCEPIDFMPDAVATDFDDDRLISSSSDLSLDIDAHHRLHATYALDSGDTEHAQIFYSSADVSAAWQSPQLLTEPSGFPYHAMAIDPERQLQVAFRDENNLKYVSTPHDGSFPVSSSETISDARVDPLIVVDSQGNPHIFYSDSNESLHHMTPGGVGWSTQKVVDTNNTWMRDIAVAIDHQDRLHLLFIDKVDDDRDALFHVHGNQGNWTTDELPYDDDIRWRLGIDVDDSHLHLVFRDSEDRELIYARLGLDDGDWHHESIPDDETPNDFGTTTVAVDDFGRVHVLYRNFVSPGPSMKYARRDPGGDWITQVLDATTGGYQNDMVVDSNGHPHIIYDAEDEAELRYTTYRR